jgi:hypothetical protein
MDCTVAFEGLRGTASPSRLAAYRSRCVAAPGRCRSLILSPPILTVRPHPPCEHLLVDDDCYNGESADRVQRPTPMGALDVRLAARGDDGVQRRAIDFYVAVADLMAACP